jgi:hypothetical protein
MITLQLKRTAKNLSEDIVNTFVPEVGEPFLVESEITSSAQFYADHTNARPESAYKYLWLKQEDFDLFDYVSVDGKYYPKIGSTVFVTFEMGNDSQQFNVAVYANKIISTTPIPAAYKINGEYFLNVGDSLYNWNAGDTRVFTYDGRYWVIELPSDFMDKSLLFVGNGYDTIERLYTSGAYIPVSKYVSSDMLKNGSITISKLDPNINLATKEALQQISDGLDALSQQSQDEFLSLESKIGLNKIYYVNCSTWNSADKVVTIPDMPIYSDLIKYDGLTLVVKFLYGSFYRNPSIVVKTSINGTTIIPSAPIYVGVEPITQAFEWKENDSVTFSYNAQDNRWYMSNTSASRIIASWCSDNDTTFINGGKIATGSITAESIAAGTITADNIAVGSLGPGVFNPEIESVISNLNQFKQQCASAGAIVGECISSSGSSFKGVSISVDDMNSIMVTNSGMPLVGTSMVVKFQNANTYQGDVYLRVQASSGSVTYNKFSAQLGFKIGDAFINIGSSGEQEFSDTQLVALNYYKWDAGEYRTVMFDGTYWIISVTTEYLANLAEWCLLNGQTWIGGGTIVTGTIVAEQIQSGSIDTAKVSLVCMAPNDYGDIVNYGGVGYFEGSTGAEVTKGIRIYGATDMVDEDGEPNFSIALTNRGMLLNIDGGRIDGWGSRWQINATSGVRICTDSGNITLGRSGSKVTVSGNLVISNIPTQSTGLTSGSIWNDGGTLKIVP